MLTIYKTEHAIQPDQIKRGSTAVTVKATSLASAPNNNGEQLSEFDYEAIMREVVKYLELASPQSLDSFAAISSKLTK